MKTQRFYYFGHTTGDASEGGMARNNAFRIFFQKKKSSVFNLYSKNIVIRLFKTLQFVVKLLFIKNATIFVHQGSILATFPLKIFKLKIAQIFIKYLFKTVSKNNNFFIEVNDLPYEQSIDLGLVVQFEYQLFQDLLYSIKEANYIFASSEMGKFVAEKYSIEKNKFQIALNGGPDLINSNISELPFLKLTEVKYVYAGSLNKGRQVEELIAIFAGRKEILVLLGNGGEWLKSQQLTSNIFYIGSFTEKVAHTIVSKCDVGVIPYDASKFYYNLCYPTKASFYLTAGLPFISTPLLELKNHFEKNGMAQFSTIENWNLMLDGLNRIKLENIKNKIALSDYNWNSIISSLKF